MKTKTIAPPNPATVGQGNGTEKTVEKPNLKALIEQERKERVERCSKRIEQVLTEENCTLDAVVIVSARGNIPQIQIVSKE
jgi:hypothetical protein